MAVRGTFDAGFHEAGGQTVRRGVFIENNDPDHPELEIMSDLDSRFEGNVEIGGLLLCKAPVEWIAKRRKYFNEKAGAQMSAVDENFMQLQDSRMPLHTERKSRTTQFGRG